MTTVYSFIVTHKDGSTLFFLESQKGVACSVDGSEFSVRVKGVVLSGITERQAVEALV